MPESVKHILVIRLSAMGDVAMTVPVLRALIDQNPDVKITVLTRAFFMPFFEGLKNVDVVEADVKGQHKGLFGLYKLARQLNKKQRFYAVADLHSVLRSKLLKKFIRCKRFVSIDKGRKEKKALVSGTVFKPLKTTHERYADVFRTLGYTVDLTQPRFPEPRKLQLKGLPEKDRPWIGVAPFAAHPGKMYPLEFMVEVIKTLSETYQIFLFGAEGEEEAKLNEIAHSFDNCTNLAGQISFHEELDLISNLDVMLSMDSGNAHIAAMYGVKVVTIWGVTHPYAGFAPFNQPEDYCLLADRHKYPLIPTSIYGNKCPEEYIQAAGSIPSEKIVEKIKAIV
ncbi:glycosyltransferase family 9 protein [Gaetbulibacter saemankumensis]|uniref:glycosyltransferase family 9 protein n=1 Tax=Gaetbulibacter saemankumensis TaxID=311208 RepID=UPI00040D0EB9|nr:glycosyltransferase family 9 protein [Gaetbulibacter saemankumensis]